MYLFRAPNCTYYTRVCLPKYLKVRGFPFDIKVSLLTETRSLAVTRNFDVASQLRQLIDSVSETIQADEFKQLVNQTIDAVREKFNGTSANDVQNVPIRACEPQDKPSMSCSHSTITTLIDAQEQFVTSKAKEPISELSVKQLKQRTAHFVEVAGLNVVSQLTSAHALLYRDLLLDEGRSHKSNKDYLAAVSQLFKWCRLMQITPCNPFEDIKLSKPVGAGPCSARQRWQKTELKQLFSSPQFKSQDSNIKWVTLLMLYHGLRPSEACQLRVSDIVEHESVHCMQICADGDKALSWYLASLRSFIAASRARDRFRIASSSGSGT